MSASASPNLVHLPSYSPSEGAWAVGAECKGRTLLRAQIVEGRGRGTEEGAFWPSQTPKPEPWAQEVTRTQALAPCEPQSGTGGDVWEEHDGEVWK